MNEYLKMIGWKDYRGRWDKEEIKFDLRVISGAIIVIGVLVSIGYYYGI